MTDQKVPGDRRRRRRGPRPEQTSPSQPKIIGEATGNTAPKEVRENRHSVNREGLEQRCIRQFPRPVLMRGRQYFQSDNVSDPTIMGEAFSLTVIGQGERYTVWIDFSQAAAAGTIEARWTSPFYETAGL